METQEQLDKFYRSIEDYPPICHGGADPRQKRLVAERKRLADWFCNDDEFREAFKQDSAQALAKINLDISPDEAEKFIKLLDEGLLSVPPNEIPQGTKLYFAYMQEKISWRARAQAELDVPKNEAFRRWRQKQVNRCWGQFGGDNSAFVHVPLVFEMAVGCSVGCPFCALSSEPLKKLFRASENNLRLWREVLAVAKEIVGPAVGEGVLYFATEPLDNPDYEQFAAIFEEKLGKVPQITTAAALRDPERVRKIIVADSRKKEVTIHRFSLLSREIFRKVMEIFTPDELLFVELLGRYPESLLGSLTKAGRSYEGEAVASLETTNTISCCTGFIVNMAEKTLRLTCPTDADDDHPTGEIQTARFGFSDAADLRQLMLRVIREYMPASMPMDKPLSFAPFYTFAATDKGFRLASAAGFRVKFPSEKEPEKPYYQRVGELIKAGRYTGREIAAALFEENKVEPAAAFNFIRYLDKVGALAY